MPNESSPHSSFESVRDALDKLYHFTPRSADEVSEGRSQLHADALSTLRELEEQLEAARADVLRLETEFSRIDGKTVASLNEALAAEKTAREADVRGLDDALDRAYQARDDWRHEAERLKEQLEASDG